MLSPTALTQRGFGSCVKASGRLETGQEHSFSFYFSMVNLPSAIYSADAYCAQLRAGLQHTVANLFNVPLALGEL